MDVPDVMIESARSAWDEQLRRRHQLLKQSIPDFLRHRSVLSLFTVPIVYSLVVPLLLLDLWVTVYQTICFRIYGIARVRRRAHFVIDRHKLAYLNVIEKAHCLYCSYSVGVVSYTLEVAARTEQYWSPIGHAAPLTQPHSHYSQFLDYGDAEGYRHDLSALRKALGPSRSVRPAERGRAAIKIG